MIASLPPNIVPIPNNQQLTIQILHKLESVRMRQNITPRHVKFVSG
ncbi:MAG: hypothetical protein L3J17_04165 [Candidatus Jettenia sp.]|nr:MAG: hypothetical protein L3J17_04165 [Candidatus Jettenia sp.]